MESALFAYLLENGPMSALAGGFFWLWRQEAAARRVAEDLYVVDLKAQITLWQQLKEQLNAEK